MIQAQTLQHILMAYHDIKLEIVEVPPGSSITDTVYKTMKRCVALVAFGRYAHRRMRMAGGVAAWPLSECVSAQ